jgi:hypothetical protein
MYCKNISGAIAISIIGTFLMCVQKNVWSSELVLAFVSVNIWRSFISCQNLGRKSDSIRISETVERGRQSYLSQQKKYQPKGRPTFGKKKTTASFTTHLFIQSL